MKDEFRETLGEELRRWRTKRRYSQPRLAELAGIHENSVQRYESGRADISALTLAQICLILRVNPATILKKVSTKKAPKKGQFNQHEENPAA